MLGYAAEVFGHSGFGQAASALAHAADTLPNGDESRLLIGAAEASLAAVKDIRHYVGER